MMKKTIIRRHTRKTKHGRVKVRRHSRKVKHRYKASLFHGTSEERLAQIGLTGGLKPSGGKLYLTDDPGYARLKGRQGVEGTKFRPAIIEVDIPDDIEREGRHFISKKSIMTKDFKSVRMAAKKRMRARNNRIFGEYQNNIKEQRNNARMIKHLGKSFVDEAKRDKLLARNRHLMERNDTLMEIYEGDD